MPAGKESELVRRGYNALSYHYRADDAGDDHYAPWLAELKARLPAGGALLDLGCGCGVPVARSLTASGYQVTGVDISEVQIERARRLAPAATFVHADATRAHFPPGSFDAIVCLYALIHMPLDAQPRLLRRAASWLRPAGWLLVTVGHRAWTGTEDNWLGGPAPMWWSHADAATYRSWIEEAHLEITAEAFVPEGDGGHTLFWARRPPRQAGWPRDPQERADGPSPSSDGPAPCQKSAIAGPVNAFVW
ncbi:MAG: class I SAM-dependent methyltransferase [Gemmatimonadota bacterium]